MASRVKPTMRQLNMGTANTMHIYIYIYRLPLSPNAHRCNHICISRLSLIHYTASPHHFQLSRLFYCFMAISYGQWLFWIWIGGIGLTMFKCGEWCALAALHKPDWPDWYWDIYHWYWGRVMKFGLLLIKQSRMRIGQISPVLSCGPYSGWGWMIWITFHQKMCCLTEAFPTTFCSRLIFLLQHGRKMCVSMQFVFLPSKDCMSHRVMVLQVIHYNEGNPSWADNIAFFLVLAEPFYNYTSRWDEAIEVISIAKMGMHACWNLQ